MRRIVCEPALIEPVNLRLRVSFIIWNSQEQSYQIGTGRSITQSKDFIKWNFTETDGSVHSSPYLEIRDDRFDLWTRVIAKRDD